MDKPPPEPPDLPQWYYMYGGESCGPIASSELRRLVASSHIPAATLVWREGMHDWLSASDLGLTRAATTPVPPPVAVAGEDTLSAAAIRQEAASVKRTQPRRDSAPRRPANARLWAWTITAAIALVAVGFAVGQVLRKQGDRPNVASSTRAVDTRQDKAHRDSVAGSVPATLPGAKPRRDTSRPGADTGGSPRGTAAIPSPLRSSEGRKVIGGTPAGTTPSGSMKVGDAGHVKTPTDGPPDQLYQDVNVLSRSSFGGGAVAALAGVATTQDTQYSILSKLSLQPRLADGSFRVVQEILDTRWDRADEATRSDRAADLAKLKGKKFLFTLNAKSEVTGFDGYESGLSAAPIEHAGGRGFQTTNVVDKDAWKEIIQLSFLEPARHIAPGQSWTRQMSHDFSPLGKWNGVTTFSQDTAREPPLLYFNYTHDMTFTPSGSADSGLPLGLGGADVRLVNAAGSFVYDPAAQHVTQVDESFHVQLTVGTELLGEAGKLQVDARQQWKITLTTKDPWR